MKGTEAGKARNAIACTSSELAGPAKADELYAPAPLPAIPPTPLLPFSKPLEHSMAFRPAKIFHGAAGIGWPENQAFPSFVAAARKETRRQVFVLPKNASSKNAPHDAVCEVARAPMPAFFRQSNPFAQDSQKSGDVFARKTDAVVSGEAGLSGRFW